MKKNIFQFYIISIFCFGITFLNPSQQESLALITDRVKEKFAAHDADDCFKELTSEILKKANIKKQIIVLQNNEKDFQNLKCTSIVSFPLEHPQEFIIIKTANCSFKQIAADIYHEIGHSINGDISIERKKSDLIKYYFSNAVAPVAVSLYFGCRSANFLAAFVKSFAASAICWSSFFVYTQYDKAFREKRADLFAYERMIEDGKLELVLGQISDYLYTHEHGLRSLPVFATGYPKHLERALYGMKMLQYKGYDIKQLIENLPEKLDTGIKRMLPDQIKQFFPEFLLSQKK